MTLVSPGDQDWIKGKGTATNYSPKQGCIEPVQNKNPMLKFLLFVLLTVTLAAEELPMVVKGQFHGKVRDKTFEQPFEVRLEPGESNEFRVEMEGVDLTLGMSPKWHYTAGTTPDGILLNFFIKCRAEEPRMKLQRTACVLVEPSKKSTVDINEKDADNLFTVEFEADQAPASK